MFIKKFVEGITGFFLCMKALDNTHAGHILVNKGIQVRRLPSEILPFFVRVHLYEPDADQHKRKTTQGCSGKRRVLDKHNDNYGDDRCKVRKQGGNKVVQHVLKRIDIADNTSEDFPGRTAVKKLQIQSLDVRIQLLTYRYKDAVTYLCHDIHAELDAPDQEQIDDDCKKDQTCKSFQVPYRNILIDRRLNQKRINQRYSHAKCHDQ